jgi:hypothetical protein
MVGGDISSGSAKNDVTHRALQSSTDEQRQTFKGISQVPIQFVQTYCAIIENKLHTDVTIAKLELVSPSRIRKATTSTPIENATIKPYHRN